MSGPDKTPSSDFRRTSDRDYLLGCCFFVGVMLVLAGLFVYTMLHPLAWSRG